MTAPRRTRPPVSWRPLLVVLAVVAVVVLTLVIIDRVNEARARQMVDDVVGCQAPFTDCIDFSGAAR